MNCKYDIIGNPDAQGLTYDQLANLLTLSPDVFGILYAKTAEQKDFGKQNTVIEKLEALKQAGLKRYMDGRGLINPAERGSGVLEGSADLRVDEKDYTTQTFIDSEGFVNRRGEHLMHVFNLEDYLRSQKDAYERQGLSKDEIEKRISILREKGSRIAKDAYDLHKILLKEEGNFSTHYTLDDTIQATKGTTFEDFAEQIHTEISSKVNLEVSGHNARTSKEYGDPSETRILKNITVSAPLLNRNGSNIYAHIDYVAIKPDGSLEIFLLKGTHEAPSSWDKAKKEKYYNEAALLLQILEANGINASSVSINLIPIVLRYDEQFSSISEIQVDKAMCISHNRGGFILYEELSNARRFIPSEEQEIDVSDESLEKVSTQLGALFPEMDVRSVGIQQTAEEYVDKNWVYMTQGVQPDTGWKIRLDDKVYDVASPQKGSANKEVVELVRQRLEDLVDSESGRYSARHIISKVVTGRRSGSCDLNDGYLNQFFGQYYLNDIRNVDGKDKYDYNWSIISNEALTRANIILFKNRHTKQLNVVMISPMNLKQKRTLNRNENILGYHLSDMRAQDNQGHELLRATNGNIEVMRGLFLLNEILPTLVGEDIKLGDIEVVGNLGHGTHGVSYPISIVAPNFVKAMQVLKAKDPTLKIENNFQHFNHVSPVETLITEYRQILEQNSGIGADFKELRDLIFGTGYNESGQSSESFDGLIHTAVGISKDSLSIAKSTEVQIERLEELIEKVSKILKEKVGGNALNPDALLASAGDKSPHMSLATACSRILISASLALDRLSGNIRVAIADLSSIDSAFSRPQNMEDSQVRIVSKLLQDAVHAVSSKLDPIISDYNLTCLKYYEQKGYTKAQNFILGNQSTVFTHLYQDTEDDLLFKNPYDMSNDLDESDRVFLKKTLFLLNKFRFIETGKFIFTDENDPALQDFIDKHIKEYFLVPLEKASQSTRWSDPKKYFEDFKRRLTQYCRNPLLFFQETYEGLMDDETRHQITSDMENLQTINPFRASDTEAGRKRLLRLGKDTFETNIQNIAIDYVFRHLQQEEMNQMLVRTRGILLYLKLTGQREDGNKEAFGKTIEHIDKYLTTSVFKRPIMSEDQQKIVSKITPLRKMVTTCYIAASPIAACRDTIQGFLSNTIRAATKFRTDIDVKDVMFAYKYVITDGVHSTLDIDLLDKMNAKWLVSNVNIEQQQEGYKTNTTGITNPSNLAYATLRKPDFLNRMVLLIAKFKHDGSLPAYSIVDGKLKYNWRLDKRFSLLASNDKSDMNAYNKQKALKLSLIMALNKENPGLNLPVQVDTDIEEGYTNQQIESIKSLGDTIYGSYNTSTKAMYENTLIGSQFGVFSTWMNGIYDVYFGKRRESSYQFEKRQAEDENGNLLFIAEDGTITTEDTGIPYLKDIPLMVQGVLRTVFKDCLGDIIYNGGRGLKDIWQDPMQQMNLRRAMTDLLVAMLLWALFKYAITPAYQEHKKNDEGTNVMANAIIEILYKGSVSCFDEFKGPAPIIEYVSDNTNPAAYQWLSRAGNDLFKLVTGKETLGGTIVKAQALPRAFQDTYKMYVRDTKNGIEES